MEAAKKLGAPKRGVASTAVAAAVISSFLFGYTICVLNSCADLISVVFQLCGDDKPWETGCLISRVSQAMINAAVYLGAAGGALLVGRSFAAAWGGRTQLLVSDLFFAIGGLVCAGAQGDGTYTLVAGRLLSGVGLGIAAIAGPVYIAEIAPREERGVYCAMHGVFITVGILASVAFGLPQGPPPSGPGDELSEIDRYYWRFLLALPVIPALVQAVLFVFVVPIDPPSFLLMAGKKAEARKVLYSIYGLEPSAAVSQVRTPEAARLELQLSDMDEAAMSARAAPRLRVILGLCDPYLRFALVLGFLLAALQQMCGINALMSYSNSLFMEAGIPPNYLTTASVLMCTANVLASIYSSRVVDHWGRRKLLLYGSAMQAVSMAIMLVVMGHPTAGASSALTGLVAVFCFTLFVMSFSFGLGAVTWLYLSEIYPIEIRGAALSVCGIINWLSSFAVVFGTRMLSLQQAGKLFGTICAIGAVGVYLWVIETKGCSMDDSPLTPRSLRSSSPLLGSPKCSYNKLAESDDDDGLETDVNLPEAASAAAMDGRAARA